MTSRKKILLTIDWFLPGTASGGPVRSYANMMAHLKDEFEFYVITRTTDFGSDVPYPNITPNTWVPYEKHIHIYYIAAKDLNKAHLKDIIQQTDYDVAMVNGIYSWYFSILALQLLKAMPQPVMVSARGMLNPQAFSVKPFKKRLFLSLAKLTGFYNKVPFHATNAAEAKHIRRQIGKTTRVKVAPNLARPLQAPSFNPSPKHQPIRFVNIARVSIEKGTLHLLKAVGSLDQALVLDLYGPIYDKDYWQKCQAVISELPAHVRVNYKGVLESDDVPVTLMQYDFFALLSEGENFGHAILEALSAGLPVLISDQTPWTDLEAQRVGWDLALDDVTVIHEAFNAALNMTDETYKLWSQAAFDFAKAFVDDSEVLEMNRRLFSHLPPACRQTGLP